MKPLIICLLSIFLHLACYSQKFNYEIIDEANYSLNDNITPAQHGFLYYELEANRKVSYAGIGLNKLRLGVKINKLDTSLKLIDSKYLLNGENKLLPFLYDFFKFNSNHCLVYQDTKNDEMLGNVKLMTIDEATLGVKSETVLLNFEKFKISFETKDVVKKEITTFSTRVSPNEKMLLTMCELPTEEGDRKKIYFTVFDNNLKMVMEKKISFKDDVVVINSYTCDDNGNVYIGYLGTVEAEGKLKKGEVIDVGKKIMIIKPETKDPIILPFKLPGYTINYYDFIHSTAQNKIFIMGLYTRGWDDNHLGVFNTSIDLANMTLSKIEKTDFSAELVKKFDDDGYANSKEKKFGLARNFSPTYVTRGDGSVDLILSYSRLDNSSSISSTGVLRSGNTTFYAGNILDAHLINNHIVFSRVPRDISSLNTNFYTSFTTFSKDENLVLLYNENESNIEDDINKKSRPAVVQKSEICATAISSDGKVKRELLLKGYKSKTIGLLTRIYYISPNSFFILLQKLNFASMSTKDTKYAKITVE